MKIKEKKKDLTKRHERKSIDMTFPHVRIAVTIVILSVVSLVGAYSLDLWGITFWSSILANIFAGLITGLVLCLISGNKQVSIAKLETQSQFLEELEKRITDFQSLYNELIKKPFVQYDDREGLFEFIYDVGAHANWINDFILQASFDETIALDPREYCLGMGYDAFSLIDVFEELHNDLYNVDVEYPSKKEIIKYFDRVEKPIRNLRSAVYGRKKEIALKLERIKYTLF